MISEFLNEFYEKSIYILFFKELKKHLQKMAFFVFIFYLTILKFYNYIFAFIFLIFSLLIGFILVVLVCSVKILKLDYKTVTWNSATIIRQKDTNFMFSLIKKYSFISSVPTIRKYIHKQLNTYKKAKTSNEISIVIQLLIAIVPSFLSYLIEKNINIALYIGFWIIGIIIFINVLKYDFSLFFTTKEDKANNFDYIDDLLLESLVHFNINEDAI